MSFPRFNSDFIAVKMSLHQTSAKPRSSKCRHFYFLFDTHNYCPMCSANFTKEQQIKIKQRCRYVRKQKVLDPCNASKDDDLDLLGDDMAFSNSQADLEGAADLFSSPPRPQPLRFESLSLRTPKTVPPTPGTALQNKIINSTSNSNSKCGSMHPSVHAGGYEIS